MVGEAFCRFMEGSLGRNTAWREGKLISRWEWSDVTTLPPESWLITCRKGAVSASASAAAKLGIQGCHSMSVLGNGSPCCWARENLHPCHRGHRVHQHIERWQRLLRREAADIHRMGRPVLLVIIIFLCRGHSLVRIHVQHKFLHIFCPFREVCTVLSCSVVSDSCDPMDCSWPSSSVHGDSPGENTGVGYIPPGGLSDLGIKPRSPPFQADSLPSEPSGKPKNTGVGSLSLLQQIFLTQESNQGLLHCRRILYHLSSLESPYGEKTYRDNTNKKKAGVAMLISEESSE